MLRLYELWSTDPFSARSAADTQYAIQVLIDIFELDQDPVTRLIAMCRGDNVTLQSLSVYYRKWIHLLKDHYDTTPWKERLKSVQKAFKGLGMGGGSSTQLTPLELLEILCDKLRCSGLQKSGDQLYRPVTNDVEEYMHAYEPCGTIKTFVYNACSEQGSELLEGTCTKGSLLTQFVDRLNVVTDARNLIPTYNPDRMLYAFRNGVFDIDKLEFTLHDDLTPDTVAITFHDVDFVDGDMDELQTPALDAILGAQDITGDYYLLFLAVVFGRTLFKCSHDGWQRIVLLFGESGTGKSVSQSPKSCR